MGCLAPRTKINSKKKELFFCFSKTSSGESPPRKVLFRCDSYSLSTTPGGSSLTLALKLSPYISLSLYFKKKTKIYATVNEL